MLRQSIAGLLALACCEARATITLDGRLDEPEWRAAQKLDDFHTTDPYTLAAPELRTTVLVHTDADGIYFGFICEQPPAVARVRSTGSRDQFIPGDRVNVMVDFDGSGNTAYEFTAYLGGEKQDAIISNQVNYNYDWDGDWESVASEDDQAWYLEYRIPWTVAPMGRIEDGRQKIGVFFSRVVTQTNKRYSLPGNAFSRASFVADMRKLSIASYAKGQLDLIPYVAASQDVLAKEHDQRAGLDLFWRPNGQHQLAATVNPDFGQVEADELVVNFSAIPTLFPDKRPFFTENLGLFDTGIAGTSGFAPFYTRRVGAAPDAGPEGFSDIDAALKYTGSSGNLYFGAVAAQEDDSSAAQGRSFSVARLRYNLGDSLTLGWLGTHVEHPTLRRQADVNAIDLAWLPAPGVSVRSQALISEVDQAAAGSFLDPSGTGLAGILSLHYAPPGPLEQTATLFSVNRQFNMNDAGFQKRPDLSRLQSDTIYSFRNWAPESSVREQSLQSYLTLRANAGGKKLYSVFTGDYETVFRNTRVFGVELNVENFGGVDDTLTRGNGNVRLPPRQLYVLYYKSPQDDLFRYLLVGGEGTGYFQRHGYHYFRIEPGLYPSDHLSFTGILRLMQRPDEMIWQGGSLVGAYAYEEEYLSLDGNWFPRRHHELRLKFQWVAASGSAVAAYRPDARGSLMRAADAASDFSFTNTAMQLRYRYEIAPLSELFVVYSHGGGEELDEADSGIGSQFRRGLSKETASQFLVKLRYRFGLAV